MMHRLMRVTGIIIALTLLFAIVVESGYTHQARPRQSEAIPAAKDHAEQAEDTALVCLALIGGTALLAGGVWMEKLRRG